MPEAIHDAHGKVLDQHVGLGDQLEEELLAARLLEVEHHRLLVGVQHDQRPRLDLALAAAHDVALRRLDLEHARAHEAQGQAGIGAVVDLPEIEDEHAVEGAADGHGCSSFSVKPFMLLSPLGERLGEGVMQAAVVALTPSPNLSPKGERNMIVASLGERP